MMVPCFTLCHAFSFSSFNMYQTHPIVYSHPVFQCCFLLNCFFILCRKCTSNNLSQSSVLILVNVSKVPLSTQGWAHSQFITIHWFSAITYFHWFFNYHRSLYTMLYHDTVSVLWHPLCASFPYKRWNTDHLKCDHTVFQPWNPLQVALHLLHNKYTI